MMEPKPRRKLFAWLGVVAGVVLALFEWGPALKGNGEDVFWLLVAVVLEGFGLAEAFAKQ